MRPRGTLVRMDIVAKRSLRVGLILVCLVLASAVTNAQNYRGEAVPVVERVDPVEFSRLRFLTFAFGREGPMDAPLPTPPVAGREYFVEADVFGIESASSIRFEIVDAAGRNLQTLTMWKASDGSTDGEFYGFVTVPNQPFRAAVSGTNTSGAAFRSVLDTVFQPAANGPPEQLILPAGISSNQGAQLQAMVVAYRQQLKTRAAQATAEHPGGLITLARAVVSRIAYEPLGSASGAPIGMRPLGGTITPVPEMVGVQSLQDVLVYRAAATYQAGTTYTFTVDMVPDYVFQGTQTGRFCIHEQKVTNRAVWDALMASQAAVPYSVSISDTETSATIPAFFPQRTFHESFAAGGAFDCGPVPNIRF